MQDRATAVLICASCPLATRKACSALAQRLYRPGEDAIDGIWNSTFYGETHRKPRLLGPPVENVISHGTSSGRKKLCRCEPCLDWERARSSKRRAAIDGKEQVAA